MDDNVATLVYTSTGCLTLRPPAGLLKLAVAQRLALLRETPGEQARRLRLAEQTIRILRRVAKESTSLLLLLRLLDALSKQSSRGILLLLLLLLLRLSKQAPTYSARLLLLLLRLLLILLLTTKHAPTK